MVELRVSAEKRGGRVCASAYCVFLNSATRIRRGGPPFPPSESIFAQTASEDVCPSCSSHRDSSSPLLDARPRMHRAVRQTTAGRVMRMMEAWSGGEKKEGTEAVGSGIDRYNDMHDGNVDGRNEGYAELVNTYYNLATDFYEWGWGQVIRLGPAARPHSPDHKPPQPPQPVPVLLRCAVVPLCGQAPGGVVPSLDRAARVLPGAQARTQGSSAPSLHLVRLRG